MSDELRRQQQAASVEQKINELVQQSRVLEAYMNDNISREATVTRLLEEARLASNAIQNVPNDSEVESFMPVGIGVYMKALVPPVKKLLINIGADVTIEKSKEDSINYIESKIKEFEVALRQLVSQKEQISMRMEQIQAQVNQMLQKGASVTGTTSDSSQSSHHNQQRSRDAGQQQRTH
jgi:prefoldin alpha subunit